ncbi:prepilin-type N-terminal cleavage/methylation domain-containing protein [Allofranklinella schreckenbergeri]|uniref:Prepilin-type N-terminal cleavage/methylation domain-containing protein n=1 Tax=Allofranklinella schreckenbergeri TaxID=1076744 RepID=A0A3M6Q3Y2_9BURK|nr:prepilin-type N-terminal cleavage/methylation domain-containing protein [Allofranklinella schreckenbergeri]RMW97676.1 prepilin-type N-terminal cleavage/methylation domain-containing protein [Allofranklinella schreckenbergeri]RMX02725.1 prepilin-type N-terminal cleavage/methylation domain-containing protein [Allofranklinella schreckenbergeri]
MAAQRRATALTSRKRHATRATKGFTLLEVLVVTALLSLVMLGLASSFYSLAQTENRVDARLDQSGQVRASMHFLDQVLGRIVARRRPGVQNMQEPLHWFEGQPQSLRWVGIMPARFGAGGRYFFQLTLEGGALVIRFTPWEDQRAFPAPEQMQARVLLSDVTHLAIQYRGEESNTIAWRGQWNRLQQIPSHVMLDIATASVALPSKIVPLRHTTDAGLAYVPSIGGGG